MAGITGNDHFPFSTQRSAEKPGVSGAIPAVSGQPGVSGLMILDYFTYAIVLMYVVEIIDAMSFAYYNLIKVDAFYAN